MSSVLASSELASSVLASSVLASSELASSVLASSVLASHSTSMQEQMCNLIELEEECKINIDKAKKNIGICKCKHRCKFGTCKFDPNVLLLKSMLCKIKIAQIDIAKAQ